jgi:predicted phage tail component-like protein
MADTIGDKTFEELNLRIGDDYQRPMSAPTRDYTMEIGGRHGAWDFGADLGPKPFSLPCTLIETDPTSLQTAIDDVTDHLFDATGRPKTMKLIFGESPEKYYMVRFSGNLPINRIIGTGQFTLPLVAFDPFSYAPSTAYDPTETYYYDTGLQYDSGLMYDNVKFFNWQYSRQYVGLYNYSGTETPVRVVVRGNVINPRITNQTTGKTLTVSGLTDGELEVDAERYYVRRNNTATTYFLASGFPAAFYEPADDVYLISGQYGDFAFLAPGKNSLLLEGGTPNASVDVIWQHKFL